MKKATTLTLFNRNTITNHTPNTCGVYYLRGIADENSLYPVYYIGVAKKSALREKLMNHFLNEAWTEIVYFNYIECDSPHEARMIAQREINRHKPKFNLHEKMPATEITMRKVIFHN